jgi:predicted transposase/invertase (TIGR01784 family)
MDLLDQSAAIPSKESHLSSAIPEDPDQRRAIDPTVDVVFKAIFGSDHHKRVLIHFINAVLCLKGKKRVVTVTIDNPFTIKDYLEGKVSVVDVKATDQLGRVFQIEIQVGNHTSMTSRIMYNWAGLYHGELGEGHDYTKLKPVISIWLLVDNLPKLPIHLPGFPVIRREDDPPGPIDYGKKKQTKLVHVPFAVYSREANLYLTDQLAIHVIQLNKQKDSNIIRK